MTRWQRAQKTRDRYGEVQAALGRGLTITEISRVLHLDRKTVRRYVTTAGPGDLCSGTQAVRPGLLDPYLPYLQQRWDEGARSSERLREEIRGRGYRGSLRTLRRHTAGLRHETARPARPPAPASKKVAAWILTPPGNLTDDDRASLAASPAAAPSSTPPVPWSATSPPCCCTARTVNCPRGLTG